MEYKAPPPVPNRSRDSTSFTEVRQSTPQPSMIEGVAVDLATVLAQTLQNLLRNTAADVRAPLQTFAGLDQESPRIFIARLREYFVRNHVETEEEQVAIASRQLRGETARWFAPYQSYPLSFDEFEAKLLNRYDSASAKAVLKAKLYGDRQREDEPVSLFIIRKRALFSRVDPTVDEEVMIPVILELMRNRLKAYLRGRTFSSLDAFMKVAEQIEEDIREPAPVRRPMPPLRTTDHAPRQQAPATPTPRPTPAPVPNQPEARKPSTPCRHCGGWHYHASCPQNPYRSGNSQGVGRDQANRTTAQNGPQTRPTTAQ